jgi:hypothetical protein
MLGTIGCCLWASVCVGQRSSYTVPSQDGRVLPQDSNGDGILEGDPYAEGLPLSGHSPYPPDYDDLVELPPSFRTIGLRGIAGSQTIDLVNVAWISDHDQSDPAPEDFFQKNSTYGPLSTRDFYNLGPAGGIIGPFDYTSSAAVMFPGGDTVYREQWPNGTGIVYGVRIINQRNRFVVNGDGGVLGLTQLNTQADNRIIGPQIGVAWLKSSGPFALRVNGSVVSAFNAGEVSQEGYVGEDLTPGRHNHPLYLRPYNIENRVSTERFSVGTEIVAQASVRLTRSSALRVGWSGTLVDNWLDSPDWVVFRLPGMGLRDPGREAIFVRDLYAAIEWVR